MNWFLYMKRKKKEKDDTIKLEDDKLLELSKTIVNRAYKIDEWGKRLFFYFIITSFFYFYFSIISINQPESDIDLFFYENVYPITLDILIILSMIFILFAFSLIVFGFFYKELKSRTYDKKRVVQLYLKELSDNPDKERKREILKHLTYNLLKLRDDFRGKFFFPQYEWRQFLRIINNKCKFQFQIIDKFLYFIENAVILLKIDEYKDFINQVGSLIINEDFHGLNELYKTNDELFKKIVKLREDFNFTKSKKRIKKIKNAIKFTSDNYRAVIAFILVLLFFYLLLTGEVSKIFNYLF